MKEILIEDLKEETGMTDEQFEVTLKLLITLIEQCETKEEAIERIKELSIMK